MYSFLVHVLHVFTGRWEFGLLTPDIVVLVTSNDMPFLTIAFLTDLQFYFLAAKAHFYSSFLVLKVTLFSIFGMLLDLGML